MANASANDWDEGVPLISSKRREGAGEILNLRKAARGRLNKEHGALITGDVTLGLGGGEHKAGSAVTFYGTSAPTLRPDGLTVLDTADAGRLWVHSTTKVIKIWSGTAWTDPTFSSASRALESFDLPGGPTGADTWTYAGTSWPLTTFATPITLHLLSAGRWLVWVTGVFNGSETGTISITINGVTRSFVSGTTVDGAVPFSMCFRVTVTGAVTGSLSITSVSSSGIQIQRLESMSGVFLG